MELRHYIFSTAIIGLFIAPVHAIDDKLSTASNAVANADSIQKASEGIASERSFAQPDTYNTQDIVKCCFAVCAIPVLIYLVDRSVTLAHELGHAATATLMGNTVTEFYISPHYSGGGGIKVLDNTPTLGLALTCAAGPLAGMAAYLGWAQVWDAVTGFWIKKQAACNNFKKIDESKMQKIFKLIGSNSVLFSVICHWACNMNQSGSDGAHILYILKTISPMLGGIFSSMITASIVASAGLLYYKFHELLCR